MQGWGIQMSENRGAHRHATDSHHDRRTNAWALFLYCPKWQTTFRQWAENCWRHHVDGRQAVGDTDIFQAGNLTDQ